MPKSQSYDSWKGYDIEQIPPVETVRELGSVATTVAVIENDRAFHLQDQQYD